MKRKRTAAAVAITLGTLTTTVTIALAQQQPKTVTTSTTTIQNHYDLHIAQQNAQKELDTFLTSLTTTTTTLKTLPAHTITEPSGDIWDQLAYCECGGNWGCNTGNGYYGGLQFTATAWTGFGGEEFATHAHLATREQQIVIGERILNRMGWGAWPGCTRKMGLR